MSQPVLNSFKSVFCQLQAPLLGALMIGASFSVFADNTDYENFNSFQIGAHNAALPTSLLPVPGPSDVATAITYASNLALKYSPPYFLQPEDKYLRPNSADMCTRKFTLPQTSAPYSNLLGYWDTETLPADWGDLGSPTVKHYNTGGVVRVRSSDITNRSKAQFVFLDAGTHSFQWSASSEVDYLFDTTLPVVIYGFNKIRWAKLARLIGQSGPKVSQTAKILDDDAFKFIYGLGLELGLTKAGEDSTLGKETVFNEGAERVQLLTVYDLLPPEISTDTPVLEVEASDVGGTFYDRIETQLRKSISAWDHCGRSVSLTNDAPVLLGMGENTITWTVRDLGPNLDLSPNSRSLQQRVVVTDTQAPILVPPPGKVIETLSTSLAPADIELGVPRVVDLADSSVDISSDVPSTFLRDTRTTVTWSATDDSGNTATASQLITLKTLGSNTAPTAMALSETTLTSQPIDIVLRGNDADIIDGVADPLSFNLEALPQNGQFISPLLPFFINDYRTTPEGPWGEPFRTAENRSNWLRDNFCRANPNQKLPDNFVYNPKFFQVTDDGTQFITDYYWRCKGSGDAERQRRISKWDSKGIFLGSHGLSDNSLDEFVLDRDGYLYKISKVGSGSSTDLFLTRCSPSFGARSGGEICDTSWKFNYGSAPDISPGTLSYARVDSQAGIAYVHDRRNIFLFDIRGPANEGAQYLGKLFDGFDMFDCTSKAQRIDIDSKGNLYVNNPCASRIYKFSPSFFNGSAQFVPGTLIGWMGRCESSTNNACNTETNTTKGFSCTDATCSTSTAQGSEPGQFNFPQHLVLDPNDILYVADTRNARIQRFNPDGTFAGEAQSEGSGINKGTRPSFILGNFAPPQAVTVNSKQFFVLDVDESFVHVFETSPLKDITADSATVSYVSNFNFHSATDKFSYKVSDGLATSDTVEVAIQVNRNFRKPIAQPSSVTTSEDTAREFTLEADDPDGILGEDFNGLDTLTYAVVEPPVYGRLEGTGKNRRYTPNANFYGTDSFSFKVNDGNEDSDPATVTINVVAINDAPQLSLAALGTAPLGFPMQLIANFTDDSHYPTTVQHYARIEWGDGAVDINGNALSSGQNGVVVVSPPDDVNQGLATSNHTYNVEGSQNVSVCISDLGGMQGCTTGNVTVQNQVKIFLAAEQSIDTVAIGETVDYQVSIENLVPSSPTAGLVAEQAMATLVLPEGLIVQDVQASVNCTIESPEVFCDYGELTSGQQESITLTALNNGSALFSGDGVFSVKMQTSSPATQAYFATLVQTTVEADTTDSDNDGMLDLYELSMGLNPNANDSSGDLDGDGLSNLAEFTAGLKANNADSDGDGIDDAWELANNLNPTGSFDGATDNDNDGFTNLQEYLADRDPNLDENTGSVLINTQADFIDGNLFTPTVQVGNKYYDLEFALTGAAPLEFELLNITPRNIKMQVSSSSIFNSQSKELFIPEVYHGTDRYEVTMKMLKNSPITVKVIKAKKF